MAFIAVPFLFPHPERFAEKHNGKQINNFAYSITIFPMKVGKLKPRWFIAIYVLFQSKMRRHNAESMH